MTSPLDEAVERLRDNALFIPDWTPPTDFRVSVRLDDLRTILNALSPDEERVALERALDRMGWPEIDAFRDELRKGQDVYEDAGGYFMRAIKALFGVKPRDPVLTYQDAARALVRQSIVGEG